MGKIIKWLLLLIFLVLLVVVAYAFVGDFSPPAQEVTIPVQIDVD